MELPDNLQPKPTVIGAFEAKTHLSKLLREARAGKRFIITQRGQPVAELKALDSALADSKKKSLRGDMSGKIWIADDFCDELEDLREFFE
ncbi:MAG: type II toxin-antitoxin system Phd/YefM family antitoxin [Verrucomicrobiales bacterium]